MFGVSDGIQKFFNLGFLGAIITTILASISWQLVASAFPIAFLSNPIVFIVLKVALAIEATGICAGAWFLGAIHKKAAGFQLDEVYVGTAEERAAGFKPDSSVHPGRDFTIGTSLPAQDWAKIQAKLTSQETFSKRRERIVANVKDMKALVDSATDDAELAIYKEGLALEVKALEKLNKEETESATEVATKTV
jgi:hypothetical protein